MTLRGAVITCVGACLAATLAIAAIASGGQSLASRSQVIAICGFVVAIAACGGYAWVTMGIKASSDLLWVGIGGWVCASLWLLVSLFLLLISAEVTAGAMLVCQLLLTSSAVIIWAGLSVSGREIRRQEDGERAWEDNRIAAHALCELLSRQSTGGPYSERTSGILASLRFVPLSSFKRSGGQDLLGELQQLAESFDGKSLNDEMLTRCEELIGKLALSHD